MERTGLQDGPLEALLASGARAVLLRGPAGCGKTTLALDAYRRCAAPGEIPAAWLLAPNDATARALTRRLLATAAEGVLLHPHVMTFDNLSGRILSAAGGTVRRIGGLRRRLLLRRIVRELHAAGRLPFLAPAVDTPGLIAALQRNVSELKRATADPAELAHRVGSPRGAAGDVLTVYRAYQQALTDADACDADGQMWLARDFLQNLKHHPDTPLADLGLPSLRTLIVDGFTDFTPTQLEILALLRPKLTQLIVTLPLPGENDGRERLWLWTNRTHARLHEALGHDLQEISLSGRHAHVFVGMKDSEDKTCPRRRGHATQSEPSLSNLAQNVFRYDAVSDRPDGLEVIAAPGMEAEVQEVARRIKRLLLHASPQNSNKSPTESPMRKHGENPTQGVDAPPPHGGGSMNTNSNSPSIAILARDIEPYQPVIDRIFRQMNIPVRPAETSLSETPVVQFCFAAVDLARPAAGAGLQQPFAFPNILRVLRNSYFRPEAIGPFDAATVNLAEMVIRRGNVLAGRDACAQAVERLTQQAAATFDKNNEHDEDDESLESSPLPADESALRKAGALLQALFDLSERSQTPAGFLAMLDALHLPAAIRRQDSPAGVARDFRAIDALRHAVVSLTDVLFMDSADDLDALREALADVSLPAPRGESLVDVLGVLDARAMRWDHVFLLGCDEGLFPRRFSDSSLLGETDRRAWRDAGVRLDLRADLTAREMLLFYLAVSRAEKRLTISYRKSDAIGRPGAPGGFLQTLVDAFGGFDALKSRGAYSSPPVGRFVPPPAEVATDNEALALAVMEQAPCESMGNPQSMGETNPRLSAGASSPPAPTNATTYYAWVEKNDSARLHRAMLGARTLQRRWQAGACSRYDGRLSDPDLLEHLRQTIPSRTIFSAAQLSTYNQCPWRYFARFLLHLAPLEAPRRELEAVGRGLFCHNVLCATLSNLAESLGRPLEVARIEPETLLQTFDRAFDDQARRVELRRPVYPALWAIQREQMRTQLRDYLLSQHADAMFRPQCLRFELSFGQGDSRAAWIDPASRPEPVAVETPAGAIRLGGRIDRVDRVHTAAGEGLFVVDYKTGRLPGEKEIVEGRNTQMPLYTAVVESLLGEKVLGGAFHSLKGDKPVFFAAVKVYRGNVKEDEKYVENRRLAMQAVGHAVEGMAAGRFDLLPNKGACDYCEYRRMCHFSPARDELRRATAGEAAR